MSNSIFDFFGLRENPFKISSDPRFLLLTRESQSAFDQLSSGIQSRKGFLLLTGEVGTGKTMLVRHLLDWLALQKMPTVLIVNARLHPGELLDLILHDFSIPCDSDAQSHKLLALNDWLLERYRAGITPVLVIDEAQGLPTQSLEELRLLLDLETSRDKLLQILLAGQPELDDKLTQADLRHIRQRVAVHCRTSPLTLSQTQEYVRERVRIAGALQEIFSPDAVNFVHAYARGIPRVINVLCEQALINSCAEGLALVAPRHVEQAARDSHLERVDSVSRFLASCAGNSLDDLDSILSSVSRSADLPPRSPAERQAAASASDSPAIAPHSAGARGNSRSAAMAAAVGASHVLQPLPSASAIPRSPRVSLGNQASLPTSPVASANPRTRPLGNDPGKAARVSTPSAGPSLPEQLLSALHAVARSFAADARSTWRQSRNFLRVTHERHGKPLLQQGRRALASLQNHLTGSAASIASRLPRLLYSVWQTCRDRFLSAARAIWPSNSSSAASQSKRDRFAALHRWLRQPLTRPRPHPRHAPPPNPSRTAERR
jgi:general secretion pathway protein A